MIRLLLLPVLALALVGCGGNSDTADLRKFMEDTQNRPRGRIEPIPVFKPYEFFSYSAAGMRSPFELPVLHDVEMVVKHRQLKRRAQAGGTATEKFEGKEHTSE